MLWFAASSHITHLVLRCSQVWCWTWSWLLSLRQWCVDVGRHTTVWTCSPPFPWTATHSPRAMPPVLPCVAGSCSPTWCWLPHWGSSSCCGPAWWGSAECCWAGTTWLMWCLGSGWAIASIDLWRCCGSHLKPSKGWWDSELNIEDQGRRRCGGLKLDCKSTYTPFVSKSDIFFWIERRAVSKSLVWSEVLSKLQWGCNKYSVYSTWYIYHFFKIGTDPTLLLL